MVDARRLAHIIVSHRGDSFLGDPAMTAAFTPGLTQAENILSAFQIRPLPAPPHPPGANGENIAYFLETKVGPLSSRHASTGPLLLEQRAGLAAFAARRDDEAT